MGFNSETHFAAELALRTQLNYLSILEMECESNGRTEELDEIRQRKRRIKAKQRALNYREVPFCLGSQLMNSLLGLLVLPQQQYLDDIDRISDWGLLPTLEQYVLERKGHYKNTYIDKHLQPEENTPGNVLKHMRNAVSHKFFSVYPQVSASNDEVTSLIFQDSYRRGGNGKCSFELEIDAKDIERILFEISDFIITLEMNNHGLIEDDLEHYMT